MIAKLERFVEVQTGVMYRNLVDAALAEPLSPDLVSAEIIGLGRPKGTSEAIKYRWIRKSGQTTGLTRVTSKKPMLQYLLAGG